MGSKEQGSDTNIYSNPGQVNSPAQEKLHMDKYSVNLVKGTRYPYVEKRYPYVPLECLAPQNAGTFRPIDIVRGKIVVRPV